MPPPTVLCDRDKLTAYSGRVTDYKREAGATRIAIHTDWGTDEMVLIEYPGGDDPIAQFLLHGEPFGQADWPRIESAPGKLIEGMRVTAWVCADGQTVPLLDWQPAGK